MPEEVQIQSESVLRYIGIFVLSTVAPPVLMVSCYLVNERVH